MNWRNMLLAATASLGLTFGVSTLARADGGSGPEAMTMGNMCMVMFGYDMIHITATQPEKSRAEYCDEIPTPGNVVMVFDIANPKFRDYPLELRIIRDPLVPVSADTDLAPLTEFHIPARPYPKGTFAFQHEFKEKGHYITMVTLTRENGEKQTEVLKFQVGETLWSQVPLYAGVVFIGGLLFAYWKHSNTQPKTKAPADAA